MKYSATQYSKNNDELDYEHTVLAMNLRMMISQVNFIKFKSQQVNNIFQRIKGKYDISYSFNYLTTITFNQNNIITQNFAIKICILFFMKMYDSLLSFFILFILQNVLDMLISGEMVREINGKRYQNGKMLQTWNKIHWFHDSSLCLTI